MVHWHPIRSILLASGSLYTGFYLSQKFNIPPVITPDEFVKKVSAVVKGTKSLESLEVVKKTTEWLSELKKLNSGGGKLAGSSTEGDSYAPSQ